MFEPPFFRLPLRFGDLDAEDLNSLERRTGSSKDGFMPVSELSLEDFNLSFTYY